MRSCAREESKGARQDPGEKGEKAVWGIWEMPVRESESGCRGAPQPHRPMHPDMAPRGEKVVWSWNCAIVSIGVTAARGWQQSSLLFHCPFASSLLLLILGYCSFPDPWSTGSTEPQIFVGQQLCSSIEVTVVLITLSWESATTSRLTSSGVSALQKIFLGEDWADENTSLGEGSWLEKSEDE